MPADILARDAGHVHQAAPAVERASVWIDTVARGPMVRQVRGQGTLVVIPEHIRWIPAATSGQVERKRVQPGETVTPETVLLELSNPQLEHETLNAQWDWKAAEASFRNLKVQLESQHLSQVAEGARLESDYRKAQMEMQANEELLRLGLVQELIVRKERMTVEQLAQRMEVERQRLEKNRESMEA